MVHTAVCTIMGLLAISRTLRCLYSICYVMVGGVLKWLQMPWL